MRGPLKKGGRGANIFIIALLMKSFRQRKVLRQRGRIR